MENFNKVLSFILGLVVVIVFVIVLSNRLKLGDTFLPFKNNKAKITVTPTPIPTEAQKEKKPGFFSRLFRRTTPTPTPAKQVAKITQTPTQITTNNYQTGQPIVKATPQPQQTTKGGVNGVKTIPSTGSPGALLPLFGSSALLGFYLRRKK